ncbi:uncharacterized protein LOC104889696 isoform X2 [Beta vulgaris subsp. vulgaris]|uniref:uncharacterized protein LOC104889696 isoform X2 n=1 Tax=Beta vulgaris subsp. vulgaris TaxID=3555 RepID=UPI00254727B2|nr:uncharacterized protein LOC104889696 isoform X2 [Beta vulgaris subsp. vulgaris]
MERVESSREELSVCCDTRFEPCTNFFSMRQYVLLSRQKDIFKSWPFAEKYLRLCLKYGVTNVLPPLYDNKGKVTNEGDNHENNTNNISEKKGKKSRKWKRKMKTMEEIFATAKHCTLEEFDEMIMRENSRRIQINLESSCGYKSDVTDDGAEHNNQLSTCRSIEVLE